MSVITKLTVQEKNKSRVNLFLDGEFFKGINADFVFIYNLKEGMDIDEKTLNKILFENERQEALNKAVSYITKRLKTKKQVYDYLIGKGYEESTVWYCIDKLKEYGYIDDVTFSKRYIESNSINQGKRMLDYKLMSKGVKKEDISVAYEGIEIDSKENALTVATKRLKNKEINKDVLSKTFRYLIGRGFSYEDAEYAISKFGKD